MKKTDVIKKPIITEKSMLKAAEKNSYTFQVDRRANKDQIKKVIEDQFGVTAEKVRTANIHGKHKKAYVTLAEEDKLEMFEIGG